MSFRYTKTATTLVLLCLSIGVGAWFRLWAIDRLPPLALHNDEGYYAMDALQIMHGKWMVFSPENTGREALYMTLAAGVFKVFGVSVLNFRVFTAILGVLTLPAIFWLGWEASPHREQARWLGLLAATSAATLLMHVVINRNALRVNMQPLLTAMTLAALLRAFRLRRRAWFIVAGALLGLSAYTYVTVRLLPILILIAFALWWPRERDQWWGHLLGLGAVAGLALLVYIPLGIYFLRHPELFLYRAKILFDAKSIGHSLWATLLIFHVKGDFILASNLPDRPVFDTVQALAFWLGALAALAGHYQRVGRMLLAWFVIGVIPSAFAKDAPSYIHAFGMVPPMTVLMGCGYWLAGNGLAAQLRRWPSVQSLARPLAAGVVVVGLGYSAWQTYQDFFVRWARREDSGLAYRMDLKRIDQYLRSLPNDTEAFFSPYSWVEPALEFYRGGDISRLHPYDGHDCIPLGDASQHPLAYFVSDPYSLSVLRQYYPSSRENAAPEFAVFQVAPGDPIRFVSDGAGHAIWAEQLALRHAEAQLEDAQTIKVNLVWQTRLPISAVDYHRFVHLLTDDPTQPGGVRLWAQSDDTLCGGSHSVTYWQIGENIVEGATLTVAQPLPPGDYRLAVGLYQQGAPVRLAVIETSWPAKDDAVTFSTLTIK